MTTDDHSASEFEREAKGGRTSLASDLVGFMSENKKWWLMPIIVVMVALGTLVLLSGTGAAPFIYTLF